MTFEETRAAYEQGADDYLAMFPSVAATDPQDRDLVQEWASTHTTGLILDVGCGPGHWTGWLHEQGFTVEGIDPVPTFIERARRSYPDVRFRVGRAEALEVGTSELAGILAWYSLIHTDPDLLGDTLNEFSRAVYPGGGLCVGFFEGPEVVPFDHPVTEAYFWPMSHLADLIEQAGFAITSTHSRHNPGGRTHAVITARRRAEPH